MYLQFADHYSNLQTDNETESVKGQYGRDGNSPFNQQDKEDRSTVPAGRKEERSVWLSVGCGNRVQIYPWNVLMRVREGFTVRLSVVLWV